MVTRLVDQKGLELIKDTEYISLVNVSYIGIPKDREFPLYVYGYCKKNNDGGDRGLVDIIYPENIYRENTSDDNFNVLCCRLVDRNDKFLYIPFYYTVDMIDYICFKNKAGDNVTTELAWSMSSDKHLDNYWKGIDGK